MRKNAFVILGALALAVFSVACGQAEMGITTKVKSRLDTDRNVPNASQIQVSTQNKVVTLTGPVDSAATKEHAVAVARGVEGVQDVVDNLTVPPGAVASAEPAPASGAAAPPSDTAITQ